LNNLGWAEQKPYTLNEPVQYASADNELLIEEATFMAGFDGAYERSNQIGNAINLPDNE